MDEEALPALGVEELEDMLHGGRLNRNQQRTLIRRALTGARQLREMRASYDREMRERVAAVSTGRRSLVDPAQVVAFLSPEQRIKLLDLMEQERMAAAERDATRLRERVKTLQEAAERLEVLLSAGGAGNVDAGLREQLEALKELLREEGTYAA